MSIRRIPNIIDDRPDISYVEYKKDLSKYGLNTPSKNQVNPSIETNHENFEKDVMNFLMTGIPNNQSQSDKINITHFKRNVVLNG